MTDTLIYGPLRTAIGAHGGVLADVRPDDLAAVPIRAVVERTGIDPAAIDDVIFGCSNQGGEDNRNIGRMAALLADLPVEVPAQTVNRLCGSGMQAVITASHAIRAGEADLIVAGGVESMTRAPYVQLKSGDSHLRERKRDETLIFDIKNPRHLTYWVEQPCDVYLVIRDGEGVIRWMDVTAYLKARPDKTSKQIVFAGERLDAGAVLRVRDECIEERPVRFRKPDRSEE